MSRPGMACRDSATGTIVLTCGDRVLGTCDMGQRARLGGPRCVHSRGPHDK